MTRYEMQNLEAERSRDRMIRDIGQDDPNLMSSVVAGSRLLKSSTIRSPRVSAKAEIQAGRAAPVQSWRNAMNRMASIPRTGLFVLAGLVALTAPWTQPVDATGEPGQAICGDQTTYQKRRLGSDQTDELCSLYDGKVMLVVNTASRCAFTDQYDGLEKLYADYRDRGLVVIGFPSNDFGNQEPGSESSIEEFCRVTYGVEFPMYAKSRVKGDNADPLYQALARAAGHGPGWNFHKYLIDRDGRLAGSFKSYVKPRSDTLLEAIERLL